MKVLVIPSWYPANGDPFYREQAMALAQHGPEVDVLSGIFSNIRKTNLIQWVSNRSMRVKKDNNFREIIREHHFIPFSEKHNYHIWIRMMLSFYDAYAAKWGKPDIIQVHSSLWAGVVAAQIKKRYKIPYIITESRNRFIHNNYQSDNLFKPWYINPLREAFRSADSIVIVNTLLKKKIIEIYPKAHEKLSVIFKTADTDFFIPPANKRTRTREFRILTVGHLDKLKGVDNLINAFSLLEKNFPGQFILTIAGDGKEKQFLMKMAENLRLSKKIKFTGMLNRQHVKDAYHNADVFVLPGRHEVFGIVAVEAMASGLPVLAMEGSGPQSFLVPEAGMLLPPDDPATLAKSIIKIKNGIEAFSPHSIRDFAVNTFSYPTIARQYIRLYESVA